MVDLQKKKKANILPWGKKSKDRVSRGNGSKWECTNLAKLSNVWDENKVLLSIFALSPMDSKWRPFSSAALYTCRQLTKRSEILFNICQYAYIFWWFRQRSKIVLQWFHLFGGIPQNFIGHITQCVTNTVLCKSPLWALHRQQNLILKDSQPCSPRGIQDSSYSLTKTLASAGIKIPGCLIKRNAKIILLFRTNLNTQIIHHCCDASSPIRSNWNWQLVSIHHQCQNPEQDCV